jgi:hypothetical protein
MEELSNFFAVSVRGESHIKSGKPLQDYSLSFKGSDFCMGIVCDGHGADKHFRSEIGSELAAQTVKEKFSAFVSAYRNWDAVKDNLSKKIKRLKLSILSGWQNKIEKNEEQNKFSEVELKKASSSFSEKREYDISSPYGTTMLGILVCIDYYLILMIGDGAIIKIMPGFKSEIVEFAGKNDFSDQPHQAVDSLCEIDCYDKFFHECQFIGNESGVAFALISDGLSEAFNSDATLLNKINNYLNYYAEEGMEKAMEAIKTQLNQISEISSMKDDISLAFATNSLELYDKRKSVVANQKEKETEVADNERKD